MARADEEFTLPSVLSRAALANLPAGAVLDLDDYCAEVLHRFANPALASTASC